MCAPHSISPLQIKIHLIDFSAIMFSSAPPAPPLSSRIWGIALGSFIMVAVPGAFVSAKTLPVSLATLLIAFLAAAAARHRLGYARLRLDSVTLSVFAFLLYAALSALCATDPQATLYITIVASFIAAGSLALMGLMEAEHR